MKKIYQLPLVLFLMVTTVTAYAAAPGWYAGAGVTSTSFDNYVSGWDDGSLQSGSVDDSDNGVSVFIGNRIDNNLAVEFGYIDLGKTTFSGVSSGGVIWNPGAVSGSMEFSGLQLAGIAFAPISNIMEVYLKAGIFFWDADVSISNTVFGSGSGSEDDNDLFYGIGFQYNFLNGAGIRLGWESYGDFDLEMDTDALIVSGIFRF
ncbi:MAG: outer membrane beta-barrel protein [Thioalkalispiraceae bacterium]|jgi:hypothetical protein